MYLMYVFLISCIRLLKIVKIVEVAFSTCMHALLMHALLLLRRDARVCTLHRHMRRGSCSEQDHTYYLGI